MLEQKKFKSIHIDLDKDIFELNGKEMKKYVFGLIFEFDGTEWSLSMDSKDFYSSRANADSTE